MPAKAKNQEWRHTHRQFHFWGQNFAKTKSVFLSLPAMSFQVSQGTWSHWNCVLCRLRWMALCSLSLRWKSPQYSQHNMVVWDHDGDHKEEEMISIVLYMLVAIIKYPICIMVMLIIMFIINVKGKDRITATAFRWVWKSWGQSNEKEQEKNFSHWDQCLD